MNTYALNVILLQTLDKRRRPASWHKRGVWQTLLFTLTLAACAITSSSPLFAAPKTPHHAISHELEHQTLKVKTNQGELSLRAHDSNTFEVVYNFDGVTQLPSFSISQPEIATKLEVEDRAKEIVFSTEAMSAIITKHPLAIRYQRGDSVFLEEEKGAFAYDTIRGFRFKLKDGEKLMGGGQRVLGMDRRGHRLPLDNRGAYNYSDQADAMYYGIPAVLSNQKYLLLFDNSARGAMDLGKSESSIMQFEAQGGRTAYVVIADNSYPEIIQHYVGLTGKQAMLPRWAFGNFASRFGYRNEKEARDVIAKFQQDDIPLDAIIFDLFWFGPDIKGHMGNLDWDKDAFPKPRAMIKDFKRDGVNTILITEPFILNTSKNWQQALDKGALARNPNGDAKIFDFYFGTSGLVDVFNPRAAKWFWNKHHRLLKQGIEGIWGDLGEPEAHPSDIIHNRQWAADEVHNVFGHQWAKTLHQNHTKTYPNKRPFIMMRSGFAGSQHYGMVPWSGDVSRSWPALQAQIEIGLQMGVLGLGYSHSDLGGFVALDPESDVPDTVLPVDEELYVRWMQYGVFQPIYRPHSQEQIPPEPVFYQGDTKRIIKKYIKLRYRLLPYLYTLAHQNSQTGLPLMRPLSFADESNTDLFDYQDGYFWGDNMIVAPVTQASATEKSIYLPEGNWFEYWSGNPYQGTQTVTVPVTLEDIPLFIKGGSFIPSIDDINTTADYSSKRLRVSYYHDETVKRSSDAMYEDDGKTLGAYDKGKYEVLNFSQHQQADHVEFRFERQRHKAYKGQPQNREIELVIENWARQPASINLISGESTEALQFIYDADSKQLRLQFDWEQDVEFLVVK